MMAATDRALEAMLALDADESKPSASETQTADLQSLPTVDERVDMFLRALHGPERDFSGAERAIARRWILDAMAADLAGETDTEDFEGNANTVAASPQIPLSATTSTQSRGRGAVASFAGLLRDALLLPLSGTRARLVTASLALLLLAGGAWTATWFYAARTAQTAIAEWIDWEARSGRDYGCGSRTVGGFPFRVEMSCTDPKATVVSEQSTFVVTAKELRATASILKPDVLIVELTGPISGGRPDRSTTFVGNWTLAQATIHGPPASPNQISVVVDGTQFYQATQTSMQPLLTGDRLELDVRLAPASTSRRSVVNIAAHLVGGSIPTGGPITSELFAAEVNAVVHGIGNTTPKALSAYLREWRSGGGRVEIGSARVQQNEGRATAVGSIGLSSNGGVDGSLHVNTAGAYAQLAQSYMRDGQASAAGDGRAAASTLDIRSRSIGNTPRTERELQRETQQAPPGGQSTAPRPQPTGPLEVQIRFVDGAVYIGSAPLGGIPPLF